MNKYRYILEPYKGISTRHRCPSPKCKGKDFVRYIDTQTSRHVHSTVGRCNRESKCGYHYTPKQYFQDNNISFDSNQSYSNPKVVTNQHKSVSYIPFDIFKASLKKHETNHFIMFLKDLFGAEITNELISKYFIGTSKLWDGATVFWQIDSAGKIRTGKIMLYNPTTGKRIHEPNRISWVHTATRQPNFELKQCLFGEHLLQDNNKTVGIAESEKTAIIASIYLPQFTWLATGGKSNLNAEKCQILKGRNVVLFPDLGGFDKWSIKSQELSHIAKFIVSDLLERKATETERYFGDDIADYLVGFDYREFALHDDSKLKHSHPAPVTARP